MMGYAGIGRGFGPRMHLFGGLGAAFGFVLFLAVVTVVAILLVRATRKSHVPAVAPVAPAAYVAQRDEQVFQIVRERLARGEIDTKEYDRIMKTLTEATTPPASS
jgi:uncharacterized membrane protein